MQVASTTATPATSYSASALSNDIASAAAAATKKPSNTLDKNAFLQLLVAQLKYQDPTSPMDTNQFMAQNAQLTSVEKLTDLAETSRSAFLTQQRLAAASMVGRSVTWQATDGTQSTGTVTAASLLGETPSLTVGGKTVALDSVVSVSAA